MAQNRFGYNLHDPLLIFDGNTGEIELASKNMSELFSFLSSSRDISFSHVVEICKAEFKKACNAQSLKEARIKIEGILRQLILGTELNGKLGVAFDERATKIGSQLSGCINRLLHGPTVNIADIGCGDGRVSNNLRANLTVKVDEFLIADVLDYRLPIVKNGDFTWNQLKKGYRNINPDDTKQYDLILLSTVLHHADSPESVINACYRSLKVGGLMVLVESCIGIDENMASLYTNLEGHRVPETSDTARHYIKLGSDGQMLYGSFIDWFYNRVLNKNINVPFNFNSPVNWNKLIEDFAGMKLEEIYFEGFDQMTVPEFHTIHVFKRKR